MAKLDSVTTKLSFGMAELSFGVAELNFVMAKSSSAALALDVYTAIEPFRTKLEAHNSLLTKVNVAQADLIEGKKQLSYLTEDMLIGVSSQQGGRCKFDRTQSIQACVTVPKPSCISHSQTVQE